MQSLFDSSANPVVSMRFHRLLHNLIIFMGAMKAAHGTRLEFRGMWRHREIWQADEEIAKRINLSEICDSHNPILSIILTAASYHEALRLT
jgi:hypothetical protein